MLRISGIPFVGYVQNVLALTKSDAFPRERTIENALKAEMAINGNGGTGETRHGFEWKVLKRWRQNQNQIDLV